MNIGTADPVVDASEIRRRRTGLSGGSGSNGGSGRGGNDDGPDDGSNSSFELSPGKAKVLTTFLLVVVMMTFGGLCAAYVVTATNKALEWHPFELPVQVWISTVIILVSSFVYHRGKAALDAFDQSAAKKWLTVTAALGAAFISSQLLAWIELSQRGLYFSNNPYAGFFYILTAVHALHDGVRAQVVVCLQPPLGARNAFGDGRVQLDAPPHTSPRPCAGAQLSAGDIPRGTLGAGTSPA